MVAALPNMIVIQALEASEAFDRLSPTEKLFAHHLARATWHGAKIILSQVSPEARGIFDLIVELYRSCSGDWTVLSERCALTTVELSKLHEYSALFLANIGNYHGEGDQKFVPDLRKDSLIKLGKASAKANELLLDVIDDIISPSPTRLGFPGPNTQSSYYPGSEPVSRQEMTDVARELEKRSIEPENTRVTKNVGQEHNTYTVLQGSVENDLQEYNVSIDGKEAVLVIQKGDHSGTLSVICEELFTALQYAPDDAQRAVLKDYIRSFQTGSLNAYRESQKKWVKIREPTVETVFGFVESYRDPLGVRAEWEGITAITDPAETAIFTKFVAESDVFIRRLPWVSYIQDGSKGPFEKNLFEPPEFTSIHAIAYCSSIIFEGINLPNYNDIREGYGFKNVIIANRMNANVAGMNAGSFVTEADNKSFSKCRHRVRALSTAVHELIGHGTGKLLSSDGKGNDNFDIAFPPHNPVTNKNVETWYGPEQTWTSVFGDLATSMEECRAMLVAAFLIDCEDLVAMFGYDKNSEISPDELLYNAYLLLGVEGVEALLNYSMEDKTWGQAHSRAQFGILRQLVAHADGCIRVECVPEENRLTVIVDRTKIRTSGKQALGEMLLKVHVYRCTADVASGQSYYEDITAVHEEHEVWRKIIAAKPEPRRIFVQPNTFLENGTVVMKEYEATSVGLIKSWAERAV